MSYDVDDYVECFLAKIGKPELFLVYPYKLFGSKRFFGHKNLRPVIVTEVYRPWRCRR